MFMNSIVHRVLFLAGLFAALVQVAAADDRLAEVQKLIDEYETAQTKFFEKKYPEKPTAEETIRRYDEFPAWEYLPRFLKLAEAQPEDDAAYRCCEWILDRTYNVGNSAKAIFEIEQQAWDILAAHHTQRGNLPQLCFRATDYDGPAQQRFLRGLLEQPNLSRDYRGFATVALAELLLQKMELIEYRQSRPPAESAFEKHLQSRKAPDWGEDLLPENREAFKDESMRLFRVALAEYADVPVGFSAPGFRNLKQLGDKAGRSLHALEHLTLGAQAPNIVGHDLQGDSLDLRDHQGKVVVISFWFTGCGPCMGLIPTEQRLVETYKDRPFVLLGVSGDETAEQARKTAEEHGITWPSWLDGKNGPIVRDWNVLGWPTTYILDKQGRIVAKNLPGEALEDKVKELMDGMQ